MRAAQLDRSQDMGGPPDSALERSANRSTCCPIFSLAATAGLVILFPFRITGGWSAVKIISLQEDHRKPGCAASRCRRGIYPHSVCPTIRIPVRACILPVIYRQPAIVPLSPARRPRCGSSKPSCQADLHLGVSMPARYNIRLQQSCDGLSAGRPEAYHGALYRVVPGRRVAARRRRACSRSAATASMGSRS
jgi:hypothetical protein